MLSNVQAKSRPLFSTREIALVGMMIALTIVMLMTPLGRIPLPMISITIAHIPILITAILLGLPQGLLVALAFGVTSLLIALTNPVTLLDPFFVNPLVSVLPRLLIPVTTYFSFHGLHRLLKKKKGGVATSIAVSVAIGNLTNTFGVYTMLYLLYAADILEATGTPAITLILGLVSTSTAIKCAGVVLLCTPVIATLQKALKRI